MSVNERAIKGEAGTGYQGPEDGPFHCANCEYFRAADDSCGQEDMMEKSKRPKLPSGRVQVSADGCCIYEDSKR